MGFNVTVTPVVQEVEISANVTPYEVQVTANQDLIDYVNEAKQSAYEAEASAISADNSADSALASATSATASANSASSSASSASSSASTATTQAGIATTKANEASQSASNALASEQASAISEANALASEQASAQSEANALSSEQNALASEQASALSASNALASANSASASASTATTQAGIATTQAGIATTQASNALASANAAAASAASAAQVGTSTLLTGFSVGSNTAIAGTDSILQAFNKTQGQINARVSSNIYSANGTLAGARTLTLGGFDLDFIGTATTRFFANGRIGIGTTTDAGFRLDVAGSTRIVPPADTTGLTLSGYSLTGSSAVPAVDISGTWNTTGTPTLIRANVTDTASNANSLLMDLQIGGGSRFSVSKNSIITLRGGSVIRPSDGTDSNATSVSNGINFRSAINMSTSNVSDFIFTNFQGDATITSGNRNLILVARGFAPTSGNGTYSHFVLFPTINQTGGANGITRGLYVNPTLTSAADWRAIEAVSASNANHTLLKLRNSTVDVLTVKADSTIGFYNATPVAQRTTAGTSATRVGGGGTTVTDTDTFDGYTIAQIVKGLRDLGLFA